MQWVGGWVGKEEGGSYRRMYVFILYCKFFAGRVGSGCHDRCGDQIVSMNTPLI